MTIGPELKVWQDEWARWHLEEMRARLQGRPMRPEYGEEPPVPPGTTRHLRLLSDDDDH